MTSHFVLKTFVAILMAQIVFSSPPIERSSTIEDNIQPQHRLDDSFKPNFENVVNNSEESKPMIKLNEPAKVFIRPASALTTLKPFRRQQNSDEMGCSCQHIDNCSIENMDFSFAVSCEYGTVRCCRPMQTVLNKETLLLSAPTAAPTQTPTTFKRVVVKKTPACKCKLYSECDRLSNHSIHNANSTESQSCPTGMVRCCERRSTVIFKEPSTTQPETHVLGNNDFRPVQLPFSKIMSTTNQRVSEQEPNPAFQELEPNEEVSIEVADFSTTTTTEQSLEAPVINQQQAIPMQQQQLPMQHLQEQHARPLPIPPQQFIQQQQLNPAGPPQFRPQMNPQMMNPGAPVRQQGPPFGFQQPPPQQMSAPNGFIRPANNPPFRQQQQQQPTGQFQPPPNFAPQQHQQMQTPPQLQGGFQPNSGLAPPPQPFPPQTTNSFPQRLRRPIPTTTPVQQQQGFPTQQPSSGGFFSNLMNMFTN